MSGHHIPGAVLGAGKQQREKQTSCPHRARRQPGSGKGLVTVLNAWGFCFTGIGDLRMSRNLSQDRKQEKEVDQPPSFLSAGTRKSFPGISSRSSHRPGLTQNLQGYFGHCLLLGTTQNKAGFSLQVRREKGEGRRKLGR